MKTDDELRQASENPASGHNTTIHPADVVRTGSAFDAVLWLVALVLLIGATMANQYLPAYWAPATNVWVRVAIIVGLIVAAFGCLYATQQGKGFVTLLKDAKVELRRITWPTKQDTFQTTWMVLLVTLITALILWGLDTVFGWVISSIIG
ncbi:MAG: preprotein translocase subunit SecE [Pseudomonadota bacterium]|nr:preprotein translocase subunit SecE [Pseudomonadota bacterium]